MRCCDLTTPVSSKRGEPCCMSYSPPQATSASAIASCISPWPRSARRIERTPPRPSVRCSIKRRQSSRALACGFGSQCVRHRVSGLPSPARRSSAAPPRPLPRFPDRGRKPDNFALPYVRRSEVMQAREYDNRLRLRGGSVDRKQDRRTAYENHQDTLANARLLPHLPPHRCGCAPKGKLKGYLGALSSLKLIAAYRVPLVSISPAPRPPSLRDEWQEILLAVARAPHASAPP